jgi:hypothetical protein
MSDRRFFDLWDDPDVVGRWHLDSPRQNADWVDPRQFCKGMPYTVTSSLRIQLRRIGVPMDYTMADYGMPVVSRRAATVLREVASDDLQLIPVEVEGQLDPYFIANAVKLADCVDEQRSTDVQKWQPEDGRPDRVGSYRSILQLIVDPTRIGPLRFFRIKGWEAALIVSEEVKRAMEDAKLLGPRFQPV